LAAIAHDALDPAEAEWLFTRVPCDGSLHFDAAPASTDVDVGFSLDPLGIGSADKRALVHLLALVGLERFAPPASGTNKEGPYLYAAWTDPLAPAAARAGALGAAPTSGRRFAFRILYRSKYLKSFLPAQPRRDRR
jgi:CRISPR-associated protein Csb3